MAVQVQISPHPAAFWSAVARFSFAPTNDQISSACTRRDFTPRTVSSSKAAQTRPASTRCFDTVLIDTSASRAAERMDVPSQSIERI